MEEINKYFLQYMLFNGTIECVEGDRLIRNIAEKLNKSPKSLSTIIAEINDKISQQLFQIVLKKCEITGEKMCVFINKTIDDISLSSANHTPAELELFDSILSSIMTADSKYISSIMCLNLTSRMKTHISKDHAQDKIDSWIKNGYLVKEEGYIYLGARTISEFEMYFKAHFSNRMTICKLCTDYVYYGKICSECNEVLHIHCSSKYINQTSNCPACKNPWQEAEGKIYDENVENEGESDESMSTD